MAATERARTAKRDEQAMTLAASQEARAVKGEERAVSAEERALLEAQRRVLADERDKQLFDAKMQGLPNELKLTELKLLEAEKNLNGFRGEEALYGEALKNNIDPRTGKPFLNETERMKAQARYDEAKNQLKKESEAVTREREKHELTIQSLRANIAQSNASINASNARGQGGGFTKAVYTDPDPINPRGILVGFMNKNGEILGSDEQVYSGRNAAMVGQGLKDAPAGAANATAPAAEKKAEPEASLLTGFLKNISPASGATASQPSTVNTTAAIPSGTLNSTDGGKTWTLNIPSEIRDPSVSYYRTIKNPMANLGNQKFKSRQEAEAAYLNAMRK